MNEKEKQEADKIITVFNRRHAQKVKEIMESKPPASFTDWEKEFLFNQMEKWGKSKLGEMVFSDKVVQIINSMHHRYVAPMSKSARERKNNRRRIEAKRKRARKPDPQDNGQKRVQAYCLTCLNASLVSFRKLRESAAQAKCGDCGGTLCLKADLSPEQLDRMKSTM